MKESTWAVTLNPKEGEKELPRIPPYDDICVRYMKWVKHKGDTAGKEHYHLLLQFRGQRTLKKVKEYLSCTWAHCEPCRSLTAFDQYLSDGHTTIEGPVETGVKIDRGYRTDFERVTAMAKQGKTARDIYTDMPSMLRYPTAVATAVRELCPPPVIRRTIKVFYLWGATGTGKTYRARMHYPDAFMWSGPYVDGRTFDGYRDQRVIILDEWKSAEWPLTVMNAFTDEWVKPIPCRYSNKQTLWQVVVITSNQDPLTCYLTGFPALPDPTFQRRLGENIYKCETWERPSIEWGDDEIEIILDEDE